jgi:hypothetical protein
MDVTKPDAPLFPRRKRRTGWAGMLGPKAKLSWEAVSAIRKAHAAGGVTMVELARQYGVHKSTVRDIVRRETYK